MDEDNDQRQQQMDEERRQQEAIAALERCLAAGAKREDVNLLAVETGLGEVFK